LRDHSIALYTFSAGAFMKRDSESIRVSVMTQK
jgi:hypothetical protein